MSAIPVPRPIDRHRRARLGCVLVGVALVLPSLGSGFFADDYVQIAQIEGWAANAAGPLDLYSFVPRDPPVVERLRQEGVLPYFTAPGLKIAFLRPLSSALMRLDYALFGRSPVPYHVHTLLWYVALLASAAALLRRALPAGLATLALLLFCVDDAHAMAAGWIAARNATIACTMIFLAVVAHLRWRTQGWRPGAVLAPLAVALGLGAGEMALGALAYLVAWELAMRRPNRARALAPTLVVIAVYLAAYRFTASGAHAGGAYLDPVADPLDFARALPVRVLSLVGSLLVGAPVDFLISEPRLRVPVLAMGAAAGLVVALWLPRALSRMSDEEATAVRWLGLGAAGALLVSTPALLGERVLLAAGLGGAVVVAALLRDAWRCLRQRRDRAAAVMSVLGLVLLGVPNLALAAPALPVKVFLLGALSRNHGRLAREAEIAAPVAARVVVIALDDLLALHLSMLRAFEQGRGSDELRRLVADRTRATLPLPDRLGYLGTTVLSLSSSPHRLRRTAADAFELSTPSGTLLDGAWAEALRSPRLSLGRGSTITLPYMTATVLDDLGGRPTRVELRFDRRLEDPSLVFLALSQGRLRRFSLPAVGQEVSLPSGRWNTIYAGARDR